MKIILYNNNIYYFYQCKEKIEKSGLHKNAFASVFKIEEFRFVDFYSIISYLSVLILITREN